MITDKPQFTRKEAKEVLKQLDELDNSIVKLRKIAHDTLNETAKVIPIRPNGADKEGN